MQQSRDEASPSKSGAKLPDASLVLPRLWHHKHFFATATGYTTLATLLVALPVLLVVALVRFTIMRPSIRRTTAPPPPFSRRDGITGLTILATDGRHRGPAEEGNTYGAWRLQGNPDLLQESIASTINDNLMWRCGPLTPQDHAVLAFLRKHQTGYEIPPHIEAVLAANDCCIAYSALQARKQHVTDATVWLLSPRKMLLVYLNANT